jgi:ABC-type cobalamin/Fe3+-siderophores transport system ATPase subunit
VGCAIEPSRLEVAGLSKTFGPARVLREVGLSVAPGELHGLVGQNGCGKSTLVKILTGVYAPDPGGSVTVDSRRLRTPVQPAEQREAGVSVVPLVGPELRAAALYKVLAATPGVRVDNHARDDLGRPAVEISRTATATGIEDQTFENPTSGTVLETAFAYQDGTKGSDLYLSVTSSRTVPPNPYQH